jgi:hypothetical protein
MGAEFGKRTDGPDVQPRIVIAQPPGEAFAFEHALVDHHDRTVVPADAGVLQGNKGDDFSFVVILQAGVNRCSDRTGLDSR